MAKKESASLTDGDLIAKLISEVASLSSAVQKLQQSGQQGAQQTAQQSGAASTLGELVNKVLSSSSRDTDVNAEEAMKSYSPVWGLNGKALFANELAGLVNARNQYDNAAIQIVQDAIKHGREWDKQVFNSFGERNTLNLKVLANAIGQPGYFHENAPADNDGDEIDG